MRDGRAEPRCGVPTGMQKRERARRCTQRKSISELNKDVPCVAVDGKKTQGSEKVDTEGVASAHQEDVILDKNIR